MARFVCCTIAIICQPKLLGSLNIRPNVTRIVSQEVAFAIRGIRQEAIRHSYQESDGERLSLSRIGKE